MIISIKKLKKLFRYGLAVGSLCISYQNVCAIPVPVPPPSGGPLPPAINYRMLYNYTEFGFNYQFRPDPKWHWGCIDNQLEANCNTRQGHVQSFSIAGTPHRSSINSSGAPYTAIVAYAPYELCNLGLCSYHMQGWVEFPDVGVGWGVFDDRQPPVDFRPFTIKLHGGWTDRVITNSTGKREIIRFVNNSPSNGDVTVCYSDRPPCGVYEYAPKIAKYIDNYLFEPLIIRAQVSYGLMKLNYYGSIVPLQSEYIEFKLPPATLDHKGNIAPGELELTYDTDDFDRTLGNIEFLDQDGNWKGWNMQYNLLSNTDTNSRSDLIVEGAKFDYLWRGQNGQTQSIRVLPNASFDGKDVFDYYGDIIVCPVGHSVIGACN